MNCLFVYSLEDIQSLKTPIDNPEYIQMGISYISALLKQHNHQTDLLVFGSDFETKYYKLITKNIFTFNPGLICFSSVTTQYPFIKNIAQFIKKNWPEIFLLIGGTHASLNPETVSKDSFDAVCIGEGEYPTLELANQLENNLDPHYIPNLWIKKNDKTIEKNPPRPFISNLDILPFPDREIWNPWIKERTRSKITILLGRGCPFLCTYCCNHALKKISPGKYVRLRSPENILHELHELAETYPEKNLFHLEIETITTNKNWLFELCKDLEAFNSGHKNRYTFTTTFRISSQTLDKNIFYYFKKANITALYIGLESGNERIRRDILKRYYSNDDIVTTASLAREFGIKITFLNMIGLPGETFEDHMETVRINRICQPDWLQIAIFFPYAGTELYAFCLEKGLLTSEPAGKLERRQPIFDLPDFSRKQIQKAFIWFECRVYKGYKPLWYLLVRLVRHKLITNLKTNYWFRVLKRLPFLRILRTFFGKIE